MKVLLDACMCSGARDELEEAGHDVSRVGVSLPTLSDDQVLHRAYQENRVLVTLDKDFGEWAVLHRRPHSGIVRIVGYRASQQGDVCARILHRYGQELAAGALVTVEPGRVRIRTPD